tara:strand:- start:165 stop:503 length:339 start_codon:yes stop_codon:yes gene_type:complete
MKLLRKEPKKISRKSSDSWTHNCEIDFILYDLPVECSKLGFDFEEVVGKYRRSLDIRVIPDQWNKEELIFYAEYAKKNPPRVWNIGELKEGKQNFQWGIKYPQKEVVEYTSY